jgi:hypothetical protein
MTPLERSIVRDLVVRARLAEKKRREQEAREWHEQQFGPAPAARERHLTVVPDDGRTGPCVYCGKQRWRGNVACFLHRDLIELDPKYRREQVAA